MGLSRKQLKTCGSTHKSQECLYLFGESGFQSRIEGEKGLTHKAGAQEVGIRIVTANRPQTEEMIGRSKGCCKVGLEPKTATL